MKSQAVATKESSSPQRVEETALGGQITEELAELAPSGAIASKQHQIQSAMTIAQRFPRNEDVAFEKLMRACKRTSFAEQARYSFPRGKSRVSGPSVNLAREAARVWRNMWYGIEILHETDEHILIEAWAWDLETNNRVPMQDRFKKLVYRRHKDGEGGSWVVPDERDLRELVNRRGAIALRNCILQILPKDLIEDAESRCIKTLRTQAETDPEGTRKRVIEAFSELNVTPEMIEKKLGHPVAQSSPAELEELRATYQSIRDGNSTWAEYTNGNGKKGPDKGKLTPEDLKPAETEERISSDQAADLASLFEERKVSAKDQKLLLAEHGATSVESLAAEKFAAVVEAVEKRGS